MDFQAFDDYVHKILVKDPFERFFEPIMDSVIEWFTPDNYQFGFRDIACIAINLPIGLPFVAWVLVVWAFLRVVQFCDFMFRRYVKAIV